MKILLTGVGCPGGATMINALKKNGEREVEIVGVDMRERAAGRFWVDKFYTVPAGASSDYIPRLLEIVEREQPDVLFPQLSYEVYPIALNKERFRDRGVTVLVANPDAIRSSGDKGLMYAALENSGIPCPGNILVTDLSPFLDAVSLLGYPEKRVCIKPAVSKGARGFRILEANISRVDMLVNRRVDEVTMDAEEVYNILRYAKPFPMLVVSEFVEGSEYTVDVFCRDGRVLIGFVKTREADHRGLAMYFEMVDRPDLRILAEEIAHIFGLDYFANIQFKGGKLIEINPRVSTFIHQETFNMPWLGIKYALGEIDEEELKKAEQNIRYTRRSVRYYDQIFYDVQEVRQ
jgi:carbamoyl-phosphate synthase large subunit